MNNSQVEVDIAESKDSREVSLIQRQGELVKIVEALRRVADSEDWHVLKKLVFDGVIETLERQLKSEAQKAEVVTPELYRLQGQLVWARKYADLHKLSEFFKNQVEGIKISLKKE